MLRTTASILIGCVSVLPLVYFALVFLSRDAIRNHAPTRLSRGCRSNPTPTPTPTSKQVARLPLSLGGVQGGLLVL